MIGWPIGIALAWVLSRGASAARAGKERDVSAEILAPSQKRVARVKHRAKLRAKRRSRAVALPRDGRVQLVPLGSLPEAKRESKRVTQRPAKSAPRLDLSGLKGVRSLPKPNRAAKPAPSVEPTQKLDLSGLSGSLGRPKTVPSEPPKLKPTSPRVVDVVGPQRAEPLPVPRSEPVQVRSPEGAASDLYAYVTRQSPDPVTWGNKRAPNETIRSAQRDMGGIAADGIYGPSTRARGKALIGKLFPARI